MDNIYTGIFDDVRITIEIIRLSVYRHGSTLRAQCTGCQVYERGFACTVMAQQADDLARMYLDAFIMKRNKSAELDMHVPKF